MKAKQFEVHIVNAHSPSMYKLALRILEDSATAQDVVQECLLKLWEKKSLLSEVKNTAAYCSRMVYNACMDWHKQHSKVIHFDTEQVFDREEDVNAEEVEAIFQNQYASIQASMHNWSSEDKALLHLKVYEDQSYDQIVQVLGGSSGKWRTRFSRLISKLQKEMIELTKHE